MAAPRGLSYAVDIVFCIDVTGSMTPIIDQVKNNALQFYDDVPEPDREGQERRPVAGAGACVPRLHGGRSSGPAGVALLHVAGRPRRLLGLRQRTACRGWRGCARIRVGGRCPSHQFLMDDDGDRRRQVIVIWTDQPAQPLDPSVLPADLSSRVPKDFSALTDLWENEQGPMGSSSKGSSCSRLMARVGVISPGLGERCPPSVAGRRRPVRGGLRDHRRLHRQLGVSEAPGRPSRPGTVVAPGPTLSFAFNLGKIPDQGEDSDPILRDGPDLGLIAVFDGMGGAGGTVYETGRVLAPVPISPPASRRMSSRRMLDLLEPDWNLSGGATARICIARCSKRSSNVSSKLKARQADCGPDCCVPCLPPWRWLLAAHPTGRVYLGLPCALGGDSRAYAFEPAGARQLTTDDLRDPGDHGEPASGLGGQQCHVG